jgi:hypothetical protein
MKTPGAGWTLTVCGLFALAGGCASFAGAGAPARDLVAHYDFEHPVPGDPAREQDQGASGTVFSLINGGAAMRVEDGAHPGSRHSIETKQVNPGADGNDDWKGGNFSESGIATLRAFNQAREVTIMAWVKRTGPPGMNSNTANPSDVYNAVGLAGILTGNSSGHDVRALLEVISVADTMRLVALGRRLDGGNSQTYAARERWEDLLPLDRWTFLAATFDFDDGTMALYRDGRPLPGFYVTPGDPWALAGAPEPDLASPTDPRGMKIGGSFPQNTDERNPFNGRFDDLMFLSRALSPAEVMSQYRRFQNGEVR